LEYQGKDGMALRNRSRPVIIDTWRGFDSFHNIQSISPDVWPDSINVVVAPNGNAVSLRSPANFNDALSTGNRVLSGAFYDRNSGGLAVFDINASSGANVATYVASGATNTLIRSSQADDRWTSVNVNDRLFRVNGTEFVQVVTSLDVYAVGITKPAVAANVLVTGTGNLTLTTGSTLSYAYINQGIIDVGEASAISGATGVSSGQVLEIGVTASSQAGVDGIVLFITADGGSVRYLEVDATGSPIIYANTTGTIEITAAYTTNLNVTETVFNAPPLAGARHVSSWKNRIIATAYVGDTNRQQIAYCGFDQIFYGTPWSCWPPLNVITIPNKAESMMGGIETDIGWLGLSDRDAYLLSGYPTDKVDSELNQVNTLQITEQFEQLGWGLGTRSPNTLKNTTFGPVWLDQYKRLQLWPTQGRPTEICIGLRKDLDTILDTDAARFMAEAEWFQAGSFGGFYVLSGSTAGTVNNRMWIVSIFQTGGGLMAFGAPSDIMAQCVFVAPIDGIDQCYIGVPERLRTILDFNTEGVGWGADSNIYFECVANNDQMFTNLYSIRFDGTNVSDCVVQVRNGDDTNIEALDFVTVGNSHQALVNRYGTRQKVRFNFPNDDASNREVDNLRLISQRKKRVL
jgi:hypothetical protein